MVDFFQYYYPFYSSSILRINISGHHEQIHFGGWGVGLMEGRLTGFMC